MIQYRRSTTVFSRMCELRVASVDVQRGRIAVRTVGGFGLCGCSTSGGQWHGITTSHTWHEDKLSFYPPRRLVKPSWPLSSLSLARIKYLWAYQPFAWVCIWPLRMAFTTAAQCSPKIGRKKNSFSIHTGSSSLQLRKIIMSSNIRASSNSAFRCGDRRQNQFSKWQPVTFDSRDAIQHFTTTTTGDRLNFSSFGFYLTIEWNYKLCSPSHWLLRTRTRIYSPIPAQTHKERRCVINPDHQ